MSDLMLFALSVITLLSTIGVWHIQSRTSFFGHHYFLNVLALLLVFGLNTLMFWQWVQLPIPYNLLSFLFFIVSVSAIIGAVLKVRSFTDTRFLNVGRLFRGLTFETQAVPVEFSVDVNTPANMWQNRPSRAKHLFEVKTSDAVIIRGYAITTHKKKAIIISHGAFRSKNTAPYIFLAEWLAYKYDVFAFDFRGHGDSDGTFDFSDKPIADLEAVVAHVKAQGYEKIGVFGRSMGAWVTLLTAAQNNAIDSVVAAAAPLTQITQIDTAVTSRKFFELPVIGIVLRLFGKFFTGLFRNTRLVGFVDAKVCPIEVVDQISPRPLLLIYQEYDVVIKTNTEDARAIFEKAKHPKELIVLAGPGHIFEAAQFHRVCHAVESWFDKTLATE